MNLDYYLEILQLWDLTLSVNTSGYNDNSKVLFVLLNKKNLEEKLHCQISSKDKDLIESFLKKTSNPAQMSNLLHGICYLDNEINVDNLIINIEFIKKISLSYFNEYAKKRVVDENTFSLLNNAASIETRFHYKKSMLCTMKKLVKADPYGYLSLFIINEILDPFPKEGQFEPRLWKQIFKNDPHQVEEYLLSKDKDDLKEIQKKRDFWRLYKYNGYEPINLKEYWYPKEKEPRFSEAAISLDDLLAIKDEIDDIKQKTRSDTPKTLLYEQDEFINLKIKLDKIPLNIKLKSELLKEVSEILRIID